MVIFSDSFNFSSDARYGCTVFDVLLQLTVILSVIADSDKGKSRNGDPSCAVTLHFIEKAIWTRERFLHRSPLHAQ
jgi:hypothetical protein